MSRHKKRRVPWLVRRRTYLALWRRYQELEHDYRELGANYDFMLDPAPEPLELEKPGEETTEMPVVRRLPGWALRSDPAATVMVPVVTDARAGSLIRSAGLLDDPSGSWG